MTRPSPSKANSTGFTMIEVLVALFVLSLGLLGLAILQTTALRFNTNSYSRTQATYAAYDIIERMRAAVKGVANDANHNTNVINLLAANYAVANTSAANSAISNYSTCKASSCKCETNACSTSAMAQYDLGKWYELQDLRLPGAKDAADAGSRATIAIGGNVVTVTMFWVEQESHETTANPPRSQLWTVEIY